MGMPTSAGSNQSEALIQARNCAVAGHRLLQTDTGFLSLAYSTAAAPGLLPLVNGRFTPSADRRAGIQNQATQPSMRRIGVQSRMPEQ